MIRSNCEPLITNQPLLNNVWPKTFWSLYLWNFYSIFVFVTQVDWWITDNLLDINSRSVTGHFFQSQEQMFQWTFHSIKVFTERSVTKTHQIILSHRWLLVGGIGKSPVILQSLVVRLWPVKFLLVNADVSVDTL